MDELIDARLARRLRLRDLHTLLIVLEAGSMARAAQRLALTQPAISKAMSEMEQLLGVPLLERDARGVRPTAFGSAMADRARAMLDELAQGTRDLAHLADPAAGEVRIGTTEPMMSILADAIRHLARSHPRLAFDIAISDTGSLLNELRARRLDVVVTRHEAAATDDEFDTAWLFRVALVAVADRRNPLLRRAGLSLAGLMDQPWTLSPPNTYLGRVVAAAFRRQGLPLPSACATSISIAMRLALIAESRFISMLPRTILHQPTTRPWLRELDVSVPDSRGAIAALTLRGRWMPGPVRLFLATLRDVGARSAGTVAM